MAEMTEAVETAAHVEKETLKIDVNILMHAARATTALFTRTRKLLIAREGGRCFICHRTAAESGHPLEAHHHPIERCFAEEIDWKLVEIDCRVGDVPVPARQLAALQAFDWSKFDPAHWETFVDDLTVNGMLLCRDHHIAADDGIHTVPGPIWIAQGYAKEGTRFNSREVIHHDQI
jgi:hypothetical protein